MIQTREVWDKTNILKVFFGSLPVTIWSQSSLFWALSSDITPRQPRREKMFCGNFLGEACAVSAKNIDIGHK